MPALASTELTVLFWSVILLFVHIGLQAVSATMDLGAGYNLSARDEEKKPGPVAGRLKRALANFLETYPAFVALALALAVSGKAGGWGATGAWVWLIARVVYLPLYAFAVPGLRSAVFGVSFVGLAMMLGRLAG